MNAANPPGLDLTRLRAHLDRERPGLVGGELSAELIEGGRSNLTYAVTDGTSRWVVRRPPLGHVLATAHDMRREHRVISALHPTSVPVPEPVLLCEDEAVVGSPFYVMDFVDGTPYRTAEQLAVIGPERTRGVVLSLVTGCGLLAGWCFFTGAIYPATGWAVACGAGWAWRGP